jgi:hypothetical protein
MAAGTTINKARKKGDSNRNTTYDLILELEEDLTGMGFG